ncbi:MAG TPA: hypothetical protein EYP10_06610, partial [Armatimonadetes bacterium]|nr:hypothetical protein [Armatimonadota bacterium]
MFKLIGMRMQQIWATTLIITAVACSYHWACATNASVQQQFKFLFTDASDVRFDIRVPLEFRKGASPKEIWCTVAFCYQPNGDHYSLRLADGKLSFFKVSGGVEQPLGNDASIPSAAFRNYGCTLTIKRRRWWMATLVDNALCTVAADDEFASGKVAVRASPAVTVKVARFQPVEAISFSDDFMRAGEEMGSWEMVCGNWQNTVVGQPELTANPFALRGDATEYGITVTGYWFWSDYAFKVAIKPSDAGTCGVVFNWIDDEHYYLVRWTSKASHADDRDCIQLIKVTPDGRTILDGALGGHIPGQWYKLEVRTFQGLISVL